MLSNVDQLPGGIWLVAVSMRDALGKEETVCASSH